MSERVITVRALLADTVWVVQDSLSSSSPATATVRGRDAAITYATQLLVQTGGRLVVVDQHGQHSTTTVPGPLLQRLREGYTDTAEQRVNTAAEIADQILGRQHGSCQVN